MLTTHPHFQAMVTDWTPYTWRSRPALHQPTYPCTAELEGAHVEYFRGIRNPLGVKVGPDVSPRCLAGVDGSAQSPQRTRSSDTAPPHGH
ncbi:3-deoxy-7-phosphoheptulonate synthase [Pseudomonas tolaasii]|uniref:Phospho-2-dehydro-3-deoxyheptonate aldolase n=2 Tax=Pseudomonas tolaasii TaxID=29442 RepID=A0A7Y8AJL8_PSETO|nr:hypothetical protein F7R12_22080 [Pseudomonas tolaasii]MBY8941787.1 3-deoxy-7-phosphoheptulonate synthase [Pseudomonas tolaasii]NWC23731.1 3-deoxy-7-phosphoheptulonate synthase [Pseudomonas tolaasii]NWC41859.1 3-deoxy-7-phosphoheptulonate synthase [Pseudomonas tolaasii]NWD34599.1 3-deoxy-7-phosphoheptulonate synthase [Pseudomonas tolaasii]